VHPVCQCFDWAEVPVGCGVVHGAALLAVLLVVQV
jgi:hypothetical protein